MRAKQEDTYQMQECDIPGIIFLDISKKVAEYKEQILYNERVCMLDDASNWDTFESIINEDYFIAYGAFDVNRLIGTALADQSEGDVPEVESVSVLSEYQNRGVATRLMSLLMKKLKERKAEEIILSVKNDNQPAIHLYQKMGFKEYRNEKMYIKELI